MTSSIEWRVQTKIAQGEQFEKIAATGKVKIIIGDICSCADSTDENISAATESFTMTVVNGLCPACMICRKVEWKGLEDYPPALLAIVTTEIAAASAGVLEGVVSGICIDCAMLHGENLHEVCFGIYRGIWDMGAVEPVE